MTNQQPAHSRASIPKEENTSDSLQIQITHYVSYRKHSQLMSSKKSIKYLHKQNILVEGNKRLPKCPRNTKINLLLQLLLHKLSQNVITFTFLKYLQALEIAPRPLIYRPKHSENTKHLMPTCKTDFYLKHPTNKIMSRTINIKYGIPQEGSLIPLWFCPSLKYIIISLRKELNMTSKLKRVDQKHLIKLFSVHGLH